jgi:hypothetical protein
MAQIARETQELVRRIARDVSGRAGAGRTPAELSAATTLLLVSLESGSTTLGIAGPPLEAELPLDEEVPAQTAVQAIGVLGQALDGAAREEAPLPTLSPPVVRSLDRWLGAFEGYRSLQVSLVARDVPTHEVRLSPAVARHMLRRKMAVPADRVREPTARTVEGELYAVNLHTGRYRVEDDLGHSIQLVVPEDLFDGAGELLDRRVRAVGRAQVDEDGLITELQVSDIELVADDDGLGSAFFDRGAELEERLRHAQVVDVDDLAMSDLTDDEATAFWAAIEEARGR